MSLNTTIILSSQNAEAAGIKKKTTCNKILHCKKVDDLNTTLSFNYDYNRLQIYIEIDLTVHIHFRKIRIWVYGD